MRKLTEIFASKNTTSIEMFLNTCGINQMVFEFTKICIDLNKQKTDFIFIGAPSDIKSDINIDEIEDFHTPKYICNIDALGDYQIYEIYNQYLIQLNYGTETFYIVQK